MLYHSILGNIAKHIVLNDVEIDYFTSILTGKTVSKKTALLSEGQVCKTISYVNNGALRAYYLDKNGKESTIMFAVADWWVTDMYCFLNERPAMMHIEAIEDSSIFQLTKEDLETLYVKVPKFERFFRILMQNAYTREQVRVIETLSLSAEEKYNSFMNRYPKLSNRVTQKQIASFLGITPEFLSAIRNQKARGNKS